MTDTFEIVARRWLESFALELKDFVHVVCDDADLDDDLRDAAAGAVLYALAPGDVVPDSLGPLGFVDDALALRLVLDEIATRAPERFESYLDRMPELSEPLQDDLDAAREYFGETFELFRTRVLKFEKLEFKGKKVPDVIAHPEWLVAEVSVAALKLDFKPADVNSAIKRLHTLPPLFRQKLVPRVK
ncbi:MAG: DUF1232 domain-containing protein [Deltaproteobacteria bacterium]